jgi:hypothetical protein
MKRLLLSCMILVCAATSRAADKPAIDIVRAAKLASEFLAQQGAGNVHIQSLVIDTGAVFKGQPSWVATWSESLQVDGQKEVGVRIKDDGTVVRLVEGKGSRSKRSPASLEIR